MFFARYRLNKKVSFLQGMIKNLLSNLQGIDCAMLLKKNKIMKRPEE